VSIGVAPGGGPQEATLGSAPRFRQAGGKSRGVEVKYEDAPRLTRSMKSVLEDLSLERLWVVYPGKAACRLAGKVQVLPLADIGEAWRYE